MFIQSPLSPHRSVSLSHSSISIIFYKVYIIILYLGIVSSEAVENDLLQHISTYLFIYIMASGQRRLGTNSLVRSYNNIVEPVYLYIYIYIYYIYFFIM